jgi:hypothetical protein
VSVDVPPVPPAAQPPAAARQDPNALAKWRQQWLQTPEGQTWKGLNDANQRLRDSSSYFNASLNRDGTFRIDDMEPGSYVLNITFSSENVPGKLRNFKFTVPSGGDGQPDPLVDLGPIKLDPFP